MRSEQQPAEQRQQPALPVALSWNDPMPPQPMHATTSSAQKQLPTTSSSVAIRDPEPPGTPARTGSGEPGTGPPGACSLKEHCEIMNRLAARGGPEPEEFPGTLAWFERTAELIQCGAISPQDALQYWHSLTLQYFPTSLQGRATLKPRGYAGDFETIDLIYREHVSPDPAVCRWDQFFHAQAAPRAVRNRKSYFHSCLEAMIASAASPLQVLNIGCGPARDVREWLERRGSAAAAFHCLDNDTDAIAFASSLCRAWPEAVRFTTANALRFQPRETYDLVWSAGLFDYLDDRHFVRLLRRLGQAVRPGGDLVIGNFGPHNPSRAYMEAGQSWLLIHRSAEHLTSLAVKAGFDAGRCRIGEEPEGVNLFLHVTGIQS